MPLSAGDRLGPYEILAAIGAGGMGEVYRARDTRLNRTVAIKISKVEFGERFEREARAAAALNHPHICQLYDVGPNYLVMEFVEGSELKGPMPLAQALPLAIQLADAMAAAHRQGITHRDLKPANVLLTKSGVKVLDFGLAKIERARGAAISDDVETVTQSPTREGTVLGTLQYMAPEQLQGKVVDGRADIFSFGCMLYEMLTGKRAFAGANAASIIAAVMERPAPSIGEIAPAALDRVLKKCLEKDPDNRWQTARDLKDELEWIAGAPAETAAAAAPARAASTRLLLIAAAVSVLIAATLGALLWRSTRPVEHPLTRLSVDLGPDALTGLNLTCAISPDGRRLVFPVRGPDGRPQLATHLLDQAEPTLLPGTEGCANPFFSPDGQWIGFYAGGQLRKISSQGGAPAMLARTVTPYGYGASWGGDGTIAASLATVGPLSLIPAAGGASSPLTKLGSSEVSHHWPQFLPGGDAVLFTASSDVSLWDNANIEAISLKTGQVKIVRRGGYYGRYLPAGYLVYVRQGVLFGVKFDPGKLEVHGAPVPILQDVAANPTTGGGQFDFSDTGTFVYVAGKSAAQAWQVNWLDGSGKMEPLLAASGAYTNPRFSPDGRKLGFANGGDIYIHDMERDTTSRLTFTGHSNVPVWAPDGKHIVFPSAGNGLFWVRSDGSANPQRLMEGQGIVVPFSLSPNGRQLAYFDISPETGYDIWTLPLDLTDPDHPRPGKPEPFLRTPADERRPRFSPDGRWIAYRSNESGGDEIYVRPFPAGSGGKWQISSGGGLNAFWSKNGHELFYETADNRIMVVDYTVNGDSFVPGKPRVWYDKQLFRTGTSNLDLAPDGKRFAVFALPDSAPGAKASVHVTMLENFFDELKRRIP